LIPVCWSKAFKAEYAATVDAGLAHREKRAAEKRVQMENGRCLNCFFKGRIGIKGKKFALAMSSADENSVGSVTVAEKQVGRD
jgi:hypothetical protein